MLTWKPTVRQPFSVTLRNERRRIERAALLLLLALSTVVGSGLADRYVHRGVEAPRDGSRLQPVGREQGTNIDLRLFPAESLDDVMAVLATGRLTHVRQVFSWREIEPEQGRFEWDRYDAIVAAAERAGVVPVAVLADTPGWARAPEAVAAEDAPPRSTAAFSAFCAALRLRYPDLHLFQIGRSIDDEATWGGVEPDPDVYAALLAVAAEALRVDATDSYLIAGEIGSTLQARRDGRDVRAIETMLGNPRVAQYVDVVAIVADGGSASPYDRRTDTGRANLSRTITLRERLLELDPALGYDERAIWLTRFGWTGDDGQGVEAARHAELIESGLRRVRSEWPWVDLVLAWEFVATGDDPLPNLALVADSLPTPLYSAFADFATSAFGRSATTGLNAASTSACDYQGTWPDQHLQRRLSKVSRDPASIATCRFWGTGLSLVSRYSPSSGDAWFQIDGRPVPGWGVVDGWSVLPLEYAGEAPLDATVRLAGDLDDGPHTLTIRLADDGELVFGGIVVHDARSMVWPVALLLVAGIVALALCLREVLTIIAEHLELLQRRRGVILQPALPRLASWQPTARLRGER